MREKDRRQAVCQDSRTKDTEKKACRLIVCRFHPFFFIPASHRDLFQLFFHVIFFFVVVGSKSCVRKWFSFGIVIICLYSWDHLKKGNELVRFRCSPESELGFPAFSGPCGTGPASSMAYLKSGPYAVNGIGLMSGMDSLHSSMGYPPGKRNRNTKFNF